MVKLRPSELERGTEDWQSAMQRQVNLFLSRAPQSPYRAPVAVRQVEQKRDVTHDVM